MNLKILLYIIKKQKFYNLFFTNLHDTYNKIHLYQPIVTIIFINYINNMIHDKIFRIDILIVLLA